METVLEVLNKGIKALDRNFYVQHVDSTVSPNGTAVRRYSAIGIREWDIKRVTDMLTEVGATEFKENTNSFGYVIITFTLTK